LAYDSSQFFCLLVSNDGHLFTFVSAILG
jgi:hypothetical protein